MNCYPEHRVNSVDYQHQTSNCFGVGFTCTTVNNRTPKKVPTCCVGQVDFPVGQVTQHSHLPGGQGPRQDVCQLNKKVGSYVQKASAMLINNI